MLPIKLEFQSRQFDTVMQHIIHKMHGTISKPYHLMKAYLSFLTKCSQTLIVAPKQLSYLISEHFFFFITTNTWNNTDIFLCAHLSFFCDIVWSSHCSFSSVEDYVECFTWEKPHCDKGATAQECKPLNARLRHVFTRQALFDALVSCFVISFLWVDTNLTIFTFFLSSHASVVVTHLCYSWVWQWYNRWEAKV